MTSKAGVSPSCNHHTPSFSFPKILGTPKPRCNFGETFLKYSSGDFRGGCFAASPHREHDFGNFKVEGETHFFKVDYYALDMEAGSEDPADPNVTARVLTIMRAVT